MSQRDDGNCTYVCRLTGLGWLSSSALQGMSLRGDKLGGGELRASKNAALLLTELGLGLRRSAVTGCETPAELLVLQQAPDRCRAVRLHRAAADPAVQLERAVSALFGQDSTSCSSADCMM